jgi:hypothetical protein
MIRLKYTFRFEMLFMNRFRRPLTMDSTRDFWGFGPSCLEFRTMEKVQKPSNSETSYEIHFLSRYLLTNIEGRGCFEIQIVFNGSVVLTLGRYISI